MSIIKPKDDVKSRDFYNFLARKGLKMSTIKGHIETVNRILDITSISEIDNYLTKLYAENTKPTYLNTIISSLRVYGQFSEIKSLQTLKYFRVVNKTDKSTMSDSEIEEFLKLSPPQFLGGKYLKNYKMMSLYWMILAFSGARTGEIAGLTNNDIDFGRQILIVYGKTGKRQVPIHPVLLEPLKIYIEKLRGHFLFPSMRTAKPIERATWHYDFCLRIKRLGIKRENLTPYSLRHSFITRNWDMGLARLQKIVGHKRIETTLNYTHLVTSDITKAIILDPLGRKSLQYEERLQEFRKIVREALTNLSINIKEEKQMIEDLMGTVV